MAENVTGQIGSDQVNLENAATEATLRLILAATLATTKEQRKAITDLVQKAGLDPLAVEEANKGLSNVEASSSKVAAALNIMNVASSALNTVFQKYAGITQSLANNTAKASDVFSLFKGMNPTVTLLATGFQKLAEFQEASLKSYQDLTNAGMSFGGSLTDMRIAAAGSYMSLEKFTGMMTANSEAIAKMGGSAETGVRAFSALSKELNASGGVGDGLRALGFTSEQMNQSMITYIALSGGRTKAELADRGALTKSAAGYMEQMDRLAEITGKSREQQEKDLKAAMEAADIEQFKSTLSVKDREALTAAMNEAGTLYGKAGQDIVIAAAQGRAVTGEAGQQLMALAPKAAGAIGGFYSTIQKSGADSKQFIDLENKSRVYNAEELKRFAGTVGTVGQVYKNIGEAAKLGAKDNMTGMTTLKVLNEEEEARAKRKKDREESQADDAAKTQTALKELGQVIMDKIIGPVTSFLMPVINGLVQGITTALLWVAKIPGAFEVLTAAVVGFAAYLVAQKAMAATQSIGGKVAGMVGGAGGGKGGGDGVGSAMGGGLKGLGSGIKGLGMSLASLGPQAPMIALGAAAVGAAIVLIGAGIAGAAWLLGKALPTLAEGIASFAAIDGSALVSVGLGITALGAGLAVFGAGGVMGSIGGLVSGLVDGLGSLVGVKSPIEKIKEFATLGPGLEQAGKGIQAFTTNMNALLNTDLSKISALTNELQKLKAASTPAEKGILATASDLVKTAITSTASPTEGGGKGGGPGAGDMSEILTRELKALNKQTETLVKAMREAADSTAKTASLIASNGNLFRA